MTNKVDPYKPIQKDWQSYDDYEANSKPSLTDKPYSEPEKYQVSNALRFLVFASVIVVCVLGIGYGLMLWVVST